MLLKHTPKRRNKHIVDSVCADPRRDVATELCCDQGWESNQSAQFAMRYCSYHGERMSFAFASDRCAQNGKEQCTPVKVAGSPCNTNMVTWYSWTALGCMTQAKISYKTGFIGRVDFPDADYGGKRKVASIVDKNTRNYFKVYWDTDPSLPTNADECNAISTCRSVVDDGCICDTSVTETAGFERASDITSKESVLSLLHYGTFEPDMLDGDITSLGNCNTDDNIEIYSLSSGDSCTNLSTQAFFRVIDHAGINRYLKNLISTVQVHGVNASFRNVPHFINFVDQDLRDMYYETDAGKKYHPSVICILN